MSHSKRDAGYLIDMLQYSIEVLEIIKGETHESFIQNRLKRLAIERLLEIIGEAANHVSPETQAEFQKIQWAKIIGLRNKIAHDYGEILSDRIWLVASRNVADLKILLEQYGIAD